jgi:hypothetical protein
VRIQVVYFEGCPSWQSALSRLHAALEATGRSSASVELVPVRSGEEAAATRFAGSPTVLVDGQDLFPGAAPVTTLTCRVYPGPQGLSGAPTSQALIAALNDLPTTV